MRNHLTLIGNPFILLLILLFRSTFTCFFHIEMKSFILLLGFVTIIPFLTAAPNEGECQLSSFSFNLHVKYVMGKVGKRRIR